jgi:dTDP-glucose pyrophosphorylase
LPKKIKKRYIIQNLEKIESKKAFVGIYFLDFNVPKHAAKLKPTSRCELQIADINNLYLKSKTQKL